jgi:hypothetical protein
MNFAPWHQSKREEPILCLLSRLSDQTIASRVKRKTARAVTHRTAEFTLTKASPPPVSRLIGNSSSNSLRHISTLTRSPSMGASGGSHSRESPALLIGSDISSPFVVSKGTLCCSLRSTIVNSHSAPRLLVTSTSLPVFSPVLLSISRGHSVTEAGGLGARGSAQISCPMFIKGRSRSTPSLIFAIRTGPAQPPQMATNRPCDHRSLLRRRLRGRRKGKGPQLGEEGEAFHCSKIQSKLFKNLQGMHA